MKLLLLHTDFVEWEPKKKAISQAEEAEKKPVKVEEALVVLSAVEKKDEPNPKKVAENAASEIESVFREVKAKSVVLYPYAHLSPELAKPDTALKVLKDIEKILKDKKIGVARAPFGWYKAFDIKCKGHPLSELSREITAEGAAKPRKPEEAAVEKEKQLKSEWFIIEPEGKAHKIEIRDGKISGYNFSRHPKLETLVKYEMAKSRAVDREPPHIALMRRLELVDYEPGSDPGNLRYMPKGKLMKSLIEEWVTRKTLEYGAMEVETPIMYDYEHPALKNYLSRFPARQYRIETPNKNVFLRFSACFGQFLMLHDAGISYRNLPLRIYELTKYSFRVEQRGELAGLRRLRAFTMPDCHALCADMSQAKDEMLRRFDLCERSVEGCGLSKKDDIEFAIRVVKEFHDKNKEFIARLVKKMGKPALMEVWDKRFFYFVMKHEWNFVDCLKKAATLSTDQIDVENAERYGIRFQDKDNVKKFPIILHCSPSGAIERVMYALLEKAHMQHEICEAGKGNNPVFPLWLTPTQVRICPVNDSFIKDAEEVAEKLESGCIRVDIDDRTESVGKKIRDAETEWINYIIVIGEKEKKSGRLAVRVRETGEVKEMYPEEMADLVKKETACYPYKPLPLDRLLSRRPVFIG